MGLGCENPGGCDKVIVRCSADSIAEYAWCLWWKLLIYTQTFTYIYHHWCMIRSQGWDLPDLMDFSFIEGFFFWFRGCPKKWPVRISRFHENVLLKLAEAGGISIEPLADSEEATDMLAPPSPSNKLGTSSRFSKSLNMSFFLRKNRAVGVTRVTREFFLWKLFFPGKTVIWSYESKPPKNGIKNGWSKTLNYSDLGFHKPPKVRSTNQRVHQFLGMGFWFNKNQWRTERSQLNREGWKTSHFWYIRGLLCWKKTTTSTDQRWIRRRLQLFGKVPPRAWPSRVNVAIRFSVHSSWRWRVAAWCLGGLVGSVLDGEVFSFLGRKRKQQVIRLDDISVYEKIYVWVKKPF